MKKNLAMLMLVGTSLICASCGSSNKEAASSQVTEAVETTENTTEGNSEIALDEAVLEPMLNDTLDWMAMQYTYVEDPSITELSVAQAVPIACSAIQKNHIDDLEADKDLYIVPQNLLEATMQNLFGKTYDIATYTAEEYDRVEVSLDGSLRLAVGDWGLTTPQFSIESIEKNDSTDTYTVTVNYSMYDNETESDSETKLVVNYTISPNEESEYGYVITNMVTEALNSSEAE